jgi:hypothetical protein
MSSIDLIKNAEFHVTQSAGHGLCYVCGMQKQPEDPGIFRGPAIDFEGNLDICVRCIRNAARQLGMLSTDQVEKLRQEMAQMAEALVAAEKLNHEQARALEALNAIQAVKPAIERGRLEVKR